jgi:hypothetical protein
MTQVASEVTEGPDAAGIAVFFTDLFEAAKGESRAPDGFCLREPAAQVRFDLLVEMEAQFVVELSLDVARPEQGA